MTARAGAVAAPIARRAVAAAAVALLSCGCGGSHRPAPLTERVVSGPLTLIVHGQGKLRAAKATPLIVPGRLWAPRQLAWMLPDGSHVKKGELVARFSAEQSKEDLAEARVDLERNAIARASKQAALRTRRGQLKVDMAQVSSDLAIARRYASADPGVLSRDQLLDAVQDKSFLTFKQKILEWRRSKLRSRGAAELAVLDAKKATLALNEKQKQNDVDALELRAPHDGVLVLQADWSGEKPHIGSNMRAGRSFGSLPDTSTMEVQIEVPQIEAHGIRVGDAAELHPLGEPGQTVTSKLSWVAAAAQPRSRQSPVKYLLMKAPVPAGAVAKFGWVPSQRFVAKIVLLDAKHAASAPNLAIHTSGGAATVHLFQGGKVVTRSVTLGVRGPARSQVKSGLADGDEIVLDRHESADQHKEASR